MHHRRSSSSSSVNTGPKTVKRRPNLREQRGALAWSSLKASLALCALYWLPVWIAISTVHKGYIAPVPETAPPDRFSEGRAMRHVWHLAHQIGFRQEGSEGLMKAAEYITSELTSLSRKSKSLRFEIDQHLVSGSFNMLFLKHSIALAYRNHTNVAVRISADGVTANEKAAVLVNGHFDSPLGSPGAADCASCVASMLEVIRFIVDTDWLPPVPLIFLFNGAEEVFLAGSHGFITTHKWRSTIGAAINVEANGARGPDLVVQSGPEDWPTRVYAQSALVPIANSISQDIFPLIPGDTDYRIFSRDFADIPGLDIILLLKGYVYHTGYDRPENIAAGALQTRGENLVGLVKGFASCKHLKTAPERASLGGSRMKRQVFFDVFGLFMFHYTDETARVLHSLPLLAVLAAPYFRPKEFSILTAYLAILEGGIVHSIGCTLAIVLPVLLAVMTPLLSGTAMNWFAHPMMSIFMFVPASVAGLLLPRALWKPVLFPSVKEDSLTWAGHWGAHGAYGLGIAVATFAGAMSSYYMCWWALFMLPALSLMKSLQRKFTRNSLRSALGYFVPAILPVAYSMFFATVLVQFIAEKLGMIGAHPHPIGFYLGDMVIAAVLGLTVVTAGCLVVPGVASMVAKPRIIYTLLAIGAAAAAVSSGMFPYSMEAPKRVIVQHTFRTAGDTIRENSYEFSTLDPNSMKFVFEHAPAAQNMLKSPVRLSHHSAASTFLALYPISILLSRSFSVPVDGASPYGANLTLPKLVTADVKESGGRGRRIYLELDLGSLQEVWAAAINITGPLARWSLADEKLPDPESVEGGPLSYICRFSGPSDENWKFWIEASTSEPLRIELGVLDQRLARETQEMIDRFPAWAAVVAGTSYLSSYVL